MTTKTFIGSFDIDNIVFSLEMFGDEESFILTSVKKPVDENQRPIIEYIVDDQYRIYKGLRQIADLKYESGAWTAHFKDGTSTTSHYYELRLALFQLFKFIV